MRREQLSFASELPDTLRRSLRLPWERLPERDWSRCLAETADLGIRVLRLDLEWRGDHEEILERRLDRLVRLLDWLRDLRIWALLQPGPWLPSAGRSGGVPAPLLVLESVRAAHGTPCAASARLGFEVERWQSSVAGRLQPHLYPEGPIVGWWVATPLAKRSDSPDSRRFLERFRALRQLQTPSHAQPGPPAPETPRYGSDCREEIEAAEAVSRVWIARALRCAPRRSDGRRLPLRALVRDWPPASGADPRLAAHDAGSVSLWLPGRAMGDFEELRRFGLRAADLPGPEAHPGVAGLPVERSPLAPIATMPPTLIAGTLAMCGVTSLHFEDIPRAGEASSLAELFRTLDAIDHPRLERETSLLWIENRDLQRQLPVAGSELPWDLADPATLDALRGGPGLGDGDERDAGELDALPTVRACFHGLRSAGVALSVADSSLDPARLSRAGAAFLVGFERLDPSLLERLLRWTERGGRLILGPRIPKLDLAGNPLSISLPLAGAARLDRLSLGKLQCSSVERIVGGAPVLETSAGVLAAQAPLGRGRLIAFGFPLPFASERDDPKTLRELILRLTDAAGISRQEWVSNSEIEVELFRDSVRRFVFLANPTPQERETELCLGPREALREVRGRGKHVRSGEKLRIPGSSVWIREKVAL